MNPTQSGHEEWRPVPGYEGIYEVSDRGRVRSLDRIVETTRFPMRVKGKILNPGQLVYGHMHVNLCCSGKTIPAYVHRLVMAAFVGPCPDGMEVCHNNGDPTDNRLTNLRYDTHRSNIMDKANHGTMFVPRAPLQEKCNRGHLIGGANTPDWAKRRGLRQCWACKRATDHVRHHPEAKGEIQKIADMFYVEIMKEG